MCCCLFMFVISCNDLLLLGCYYLSLFVAMCYYLLLFVAIRCYLLPFVAICFYLLIFVWAKCTYSTLQLQPTRHLYTFRRKLNVYFKTPVAKPWVASILISRHMVKYSAWEIEKKTWMCSLCGVCLRGAYADSLVFNKIRTFKIIVKKTKFYLRGAGQTTALQLRSNKWLSNSVHPQYRFRIKQFALTW